VVFFHFTVYWYFDVVVFKNVVSLSGFDRRCGMHVRYQLAKKRFIAVMDRGRAMFCWFKQCAWFRQEIVHYYITGSIITVLDTHCLDKYPYDTSYREQVFNCCYH